MNKLITSLLASLALVASPAFAQTYPSPTYQNLTVLGNATVNGAALTPSSAFSVLTYGADRTGATNSTAAFNSAATAALAANPLGGVIVIPCGAYLLTPGIDWVIPSPGALNIQGGGNDCTILKFAAPTTAAITIEYASNQSSFTLKDLTLAAGNTSSTSQGLFLKFDGTTQAQNFPLSVIDHVSLRGDTGYGAGHYWGVGINVQAISNITFSNDNSAGLQSGTPAGIGVQIQGTANGCGTPVNTATSICYATNFNFNNDMFFPVGGAGIVYGNYSQGYQISGSSFLGLGGGASDAIFVPAGLTGAGFGQDGLSLTNNNFGETNVSLLSTVNHVMATGNYFITKGPDVAIQGIITNGSIVGNSFLAAVPTSAVAIALFSGSTQIAITGNNFTSYPTGVLVQSGATSVNTQSNAYNAVTTSVLNNGGATNKIGGGSP